MSCKCSDPSPRDFSLSGKRTTALYEPLRHGLVEVVAEPNQQSCASPLEHRLKGVEGGHQNHEGHEGRHAAARQHAVVDLQHKQRAGQHQQVDQRAEGRHADKGTSETPECLGELGALAGLGRGIRHCSGPSSCSTPLLVCHGRIKGLSRLHLQT